VKLAVTTPFIQVDGIRLMGVVSLLSAVLISPYLQPEKWPPPTFTGAVVTGEDHGMREGADG